MDGILVKLATRSRPERFGNTIKLYRADPLPRILVSIDEDDASMNRTAVLAVIVEMGNVKVRIGNSKSKIEAINDGIADEKWSLLIVGADDMIPRDAYYAQRILALYEQRFADFDGVLHLNDGNNGKVLNTLPIVGRKYFDRFGYVYHPSYASLFADNEFQEVAENQGKSAYVDEVVIRHDWIGVSAPDDLHQRNESFYSQDRKVFSLRKSKGFPHELIGGVA